ncbi:MAG: tetratricopeptide repeat protein, partial [Candidatus Riflebacteria bacterium]|nr:tetratricopeptide repeat protein [Candidatus Riflebacteria bacterium]
RFRAINAGGGQEETEVRGVLSELERLGRQLSPAGDTVAASSSLRDRTADLMKEVQDRLAALRYPDLLASGKSELEAGHLDKARDLFERFLAAKPARVWEAEARLALARVLLQKGKPVEALTHLDEILRANAEDGEAWFLKGHCLGLTELTRSGRGDPTKQAIDAFERAASLMSDDARPPARLAALYAAAGHAEKSRQSFDRAERIASARQTGANRAEGRFLSRARAGGE